MFRKKRTHLFRAGNGGRDRGNNFRVVLLCLKSSLTFFVWHWHLGSLLVLGTRWVCGHGKWWWLEKFCVALTWGHCQRWGPGWVWAWEIVIAGKRFSVFLKSFLLFVIRNIPFLGSPITFFDIFIRTDSEWPNKGIFQPINTSDFNQT